MTPSRHWALRAGPFGLPACRARHSDFRHRPIKLAAGPIRRFAESGNRCGFDAKTVAAVCLFPRERTGSQSRDRTCLWRPDPSGADVKVNSAPYCHWTQAINVAQWQPGGEVCLMSQPRWHQRRFPLPGAIRKGEGEAPAAPAVQRLVDPQHPIGLEKARIPQRASINRLEAEARDQR
jgi:hypothetical protein